MARRERAACWPCRHDRRVNHPGVGAYFRIDDFDPFTDGKQYAAKVASPFWRKAHRQEWAKEAAALWDRYFVHGRVMKAIDVNNLLPST